jgi:hypothetical protein
VTIDEDPGWWPAIKRLPRSLIPFLEFRPTRRKVSRPDLIKLRTMHLSMATTLPLLVLAFSFVEVEEEASRAAWGWPGHRHDPGAPPRSAGGEDRPE